jgi:hypothetical protein
VGRQEKRAGWQLEANRVSESARTRIVLDARQIVFGACQDAKGIDAEMTVG